MAIELLDLPVDVLIAIFQNLRLIDLRNLMLTSRILYDIIINVNDLWRSVSKKRIVLKSRNSKEEFQNWYHKCRIANNWCKGVYKTQILSQSRTSYMPWINYHNNEALLLSLGSELHCYIDDKRGFPKRNCVKWKFEVPIVRRHDCRTNDVSRFSIKKHLMVCGNRDGSMAIYKLNGVDKPPLLLQHIKDCHSDGNVEVSAVEIIQDDENFCILTASSKNPFVAFWQNGCNSYPNFDKLMEVPVADGEGVRSLSIQDSRNMLAVGLDGNSKPVVLDVTVGSFVTRADTTVNPANAVWDAHWHNENTIVYVTHSGSLCLLDTRINDPVYEVKDPFQAKLYCVKSDGDHGIVVGSSQYCRCVLFDARQRRSCVQMYFTLRRSSPVYCLEFDSTKLIAAADRAVSILNFNVNLENVGCRDYSHVFFSS